MFSIKKFLLYVEDLENRIKGLEEAYGRIEKLYNKLYEESHPQVMGRKRGN